MTPEAVRVLQALEWSERTALSETLPMMWIARATLGGNDDLAAKVLADLDLEGCVHTRMMGWTNGSLTSKGRAIGALGVI